MRNIMIKRIITSILAAGAIACALNAQTVSVQTQPKESDYQFTTIKEAPITSLKNQYR